MYQIFLNEQVSYKAMSYFQNIFQPVIFYFDYAQYLNILQPLHYYSKNNIPCLLMYLFLFYSSLSFYTEFHQHHQLMVHCYEVLRMFAVVQDLMICVWFYNSEYLLLSCSRGLSFFLNIDFFFHITLKHKITSVKSPIIFIII